MRCFLAFFVFLSSYLYVAAQEPMLWTQRTNVGSPGLIEGAAMAFDEHQGVTLLFGGDKHLLGQALGLVSNELWQYNGTLWQQVTVTGPQPQPRSGHSMVYDPVDERVLMFGGDGGGVMLADLWAFEFSGTAAGSWVQLASLPSAGRAGAAMGYDSVGDRFIIAGGIKEGTAEVEPEAGPVYGTVKPATRETWKWNRSIWSAGPEAPLYNNGPLQNNPNTGPVQHFIMAGPAGGTIAHHTASGKTMLLSERMFPVIGTPVANYVYGVGDYPLYTPDAWGPNLGGVKYFVGGNWPGYFSVSSYSRVVATYDPARRRVIAYGAGRSNSEEYNGDTWTSTEGTIRGRFGPLPAARLRPAMAHDTVRGVTVFFGGMVSLTEAGDTWELVENPAVPFGITTDLSSTPLEPCLGGSIMLTGAAQGVGPFTWRWFRDGTLLSTTATPTFTLTGIQPNQSGLYSFEVEDSTGRRLTSTTTPVYVHAPPQITQQPVDRRVIPGESFSLLVEVSSSLPVTYQWFKDGQPVSGATSAHFTKNSAVIADAGLYYVQITSRCTMIESQACRLYVGPYIVTSPAAPVGLAVMDNPVSMNVAGGGVGAQVGSYSIGSDPTQHPNRHAPDSPTHPLPMTFVWRHEGVPLAPGAKYSITNTATTSQLTINQPDYEDEGYYDCVVTDASGPAYAKITQQTLLVLQPLAPPWLTIQEGRGPDPRNYAGMVYDSQRKRTVLFGGQCYGVNPRSGTANSGYYFSNDTWEWDGQIWVKRNPSNQPPPMQEFGIAYDSNRGCTVIFGGVKYAAPGYTTGTISHDVWEWDGTDWTQRFSANGPPHARTRPSMCFDPVRNEVLMLGGNILSPEPAGFYYTARKQLWAWNGIEWTLRSTLPNGEDTPQIYGDRKSFAFDEKRGVAVLFGGFNDSSQYKVWEWNGTAWSHQLPPTSLRIVASEQSPNAFYDPVRRSIGIPIISNNLFPGGGPSLATLVYWNGTDFTRGNTSLINDLTGTTVTQGELAGPTGETRDLAVFDRHRRCLVWHDTESFIYNGPAHTREMHFSDKVKPVHQPFEVIFSSNQTITVRAIHAGRRPLVHQWFKNGSPILDDTHYSGTNTANLTITGTTAADAGNYTLRVTNLHNQTETQAIRLTLHDTGISMVVQGSGLVLSWPGTTGILETAVDVTGPWTPIYGSSPPYSVAMDEARRFYRVRYP